MDSGKIERRAKERRARGEKGKEKERKNILLALKGRNISARGAAPRLRKDGLRFYLL